MPMGEMRDEDTKPDPKKCKDIEHGRGAPCPSCGVTSGRDPMG